MGHTREYLEAWGTQRHTWIPRTHKGAFGDTGHTIAHLETKGILEDMGTQGHTLKHEAYRGALVDMQHTKAYLETWGTHGRT